MGPLRAFLGLTAAQQRTAAAALVVLVSLGTPWYSTEVVFPARPGQAPSISRGTMSGIGAFSFVEAAVLLVAVAVLVLVWARASGRAFSLPTADGTVITLAAGWIGLLIVYRLFDRPEGDADGGSATLIGLSWGIFASLAAVGLLLATGLDQRRRAAEERAGDPVAPEGPVVDPQDVVPVAAPAGRPGRSGEARGDRGGRRAPRAEPGRPEWPGPGPAPSAPAPAAREPRSWSWDDPDAPGPEPARGEPSRRRPTPPGEPTRALGRDDAAAELRDAGIGPDARLGSPSPGRPGPARDPEDDAATRVSPPAPEEATRVAPPTGEATDGAPGAPGDDATRVHRGRRRRRDER
jgi:hypothetical protein